MIVHRILDAVFRTLDAVDAVRAKVDHALGKEPQPPSSWPPLVETTPPHSADLDNAQRTYTDSDTGAEVPAVPRPVDQQKPPRTSAPKPKTSAPKAPKPKGTTGAEKRESPAAKAPKKKSDSRKGSVDRKGSDFDSPRARAIQTYLSDHGGAVVAEGAALDGKKTLARVLWSVGAAEAAGSAQGLTAADASALLSTVAGLEVFSTNIARAFRDENELFEETVPDGRSKRYKLTARGRGRLSEVTTR